MLIRNHCDVDFNNEDERGSSAIFATRNYLLIQGSLLPQAANVGCISAKYGSTSVRYEG